MSRHGWIYYLCCLLGLGVLNAQMPTCPSPYVYMDGGSLIKFYDPSQPLSATNPGTINVPTFGSGLTLMPNINGGTPNPTFYTVSGGNYYYWNGSSWVNTGHGTGNSAAVNIAGCNNYIYNLVGGTGQVYVYNGSSTGTLLTTLQNFSGGGPYDLVTDCNCNFYALKTTTPQVLTMYSPTGSVLCTYSLNNMPAASAGGGFAIIGNSIYVKNNLSNGFFIGTISGAQVTFTQVSGFSASPGDFASCPVCNSSGTLTGASISAASLSCYNPTANLSVTYSGSGAIGIAWSGPGIVGSTTTNVITVNQPGVYTVTLSANGCPPSSAVLSTTVPLNNGNVAASITPSGNICITNGIFQQLVVAHNNTSDLISWSGTGINGSNTQSVYISAAGSYSVLVTDPVSGCTASSVVNFIQNPNPAIALSSPTLCAFNTNGSPNTVTISTTGAQQYTLYTGSSLQSTAPFSTLQTIVSISPYSPTLTVKTITLIGANVTCTAATTATLAILPNPTITVTPPTASICPYQIQQFSASGAQNYQWLAPINSQNAQIIVQTPSATSVYSVSGESNGCKAAIATATLVILPIPSLTVVPGNTLVCLGTSVTMSVQGNATQYAWIPTATLNHTFGTQVTANTPTTQIYTVIGTLNTCTNVSTATINIANPPVISVSANSPSMCAFNHNGSINSISLTVNGPSSFTVIGNGVNVLNQNGPVPVIVPSGTFLPGFSPVSIQVLGAQSVCTVTANYNYSIMQNPSITIFPASASVCPGQMKMFSVTGASSYSWLPDPTLVISTPTSVIANPTKTSFYSVRGLFNGCYSDVQNAVLLVLPLPEVSVAASSPTVCAGKHVVLTAFGSANTYSWQPNTSLAAANVPTVIAIPPITTQYTVTGTLNSCTNAAVVTISVITVPVVSLTASDHTICSGRETQLIASGALSYLWKPAFSLNMNAGPSVVANPIENTTYTVDGYNGVCTGSASIYIHTVKSPDMKITASNLAVCRGNTITLAATGAMSYSWAPPNGLTSTPTLSQVTILPNTGTNYTVFGANYLGGVECYQQLSYFVNVINPTHALIDGTLSICEGQGTTLKASGGDTYKWMPSTGLNIDNQAAVVANPSVTTIYKVEVSYNSYCPSTASVQVDVYPRPKVFAGRDTSFNLNEPKFIRAIGNGTLSWIDGTGIECRDCAETRIYPVFYGCYVAQAVNEYGCVARDLVCIEVREDFSAYVPNVFTPNGDGLNDKFFIYGEAISNISLRIFDRWGHVVFSGTDIETGWDGTFKGVDCKSDVYSYQASWYGLDRRKYEKSGIVRLER